MGNRFCQGAFLVCHKIAVIMGAVCRNQGGSKNWSFSKMHKINEDQFCWTQFTDRAWHPKMHGFMVEFML